MNELKQKLIGYLNAASKVIEKNRHQTANRIVIGYGTVKNFMVFAKIENFDDAVKIIEKYYNNECSKDEQALLASFSQHSIDNHMSKIEKLVN